MDPTGNVGPEGGNQAVQTPPAPASTAPQTPTGGASQDYIQVQREQLRDWNGDYHSTIREARAYRENQQSIQEMQRLGQLGVTGQEVNALREMVQVLHDTGVTPSQYLAYLREGQGGNGNASPDEQNAETPLTLDQIKELLSNTLDERDAKSAEKTNAQRQKEQEQQGWQTEVRHATDVLKKFGIDAESKPEDFEFWRDNFQNWAVKKAISESFLPHMTAEERNKLLASPAKPEHLARASELMETRMKTMNLQAVADFAKGQDNVPSATHSAGAGGRPPEKSPDEMTAEERVAAIVAEL